MGGVDLSWLAGSITAAALYYLLGRKYARRYKQVAGKSMVFKEASS